MIPPRTALILCMVAFLARAGGALVSREFPGGGGLGRALGAGSSNNRDLTASSSSAEPPWWRPCG
ncbi:MAG: hypothetical protein JRH05_14685 [Deltaproteobacteria bacterium]|nr:hypothetical protein [Deltaproteobacteria bacterium]MBW2103875.1 hypothetical protein [Deltaproteobacteria bacterium]